MNLSKLAASRLLFATTLVAVSAALAGCDQVVSSANAQALTPVAATQVVYVGDEYAAIQAQLRVDATAQAPSF